VMGQQAGCPAIPIAESAYLHGTEERHQPTRVPPLVRQRTPFLIPDLPHTRPQSAQVQMILKELPDQLETIAFEHLLELAVRQSAGFRCAQTGDEQLDLLSSGSEGLVSDDGACFHGRGAWWRGNICPRTYLSRGPLSSRHPGGKSAKPLGLCVVQKDPHPIHAAYADHPGRERLRKCLTFAKKTAY